MFPPTTWQEIDAYDHAEVIEGYKSHERGDPVPGPNHSDGFRWGWTNREHDRNYREVDDGFNPLRMAYIAAKQAAMPRVAETFVPVGAAAKAVLDRIKVRAPNDDRR